jgi:hypothetical protein
MSIFMVFQATPQEAKRASLSQETGWSNFTLQKTKTKLKTLKTDSRRSNSQKFNEILLHFGGGIMGLDLFEVGPWLAQQLPKSAANARPGHQGPEADVNL